MTSKLLVYAAVSLLLLSAAGRLHANDEASILNQFQQSVHAADIKAAEGDFQRDHPNPPTKAEADKMVAAITQAALGAMDEAQELEKQFPESARLPEVRGRLGETLGNVFGITGLPIPRERAADVEACTRRLLAGDPKDIRLNLVLYCVAASLPPAPQHSLYQELSSDATPEPARSMARRALRELARVGKPLDLSFTALDGRKVDLADMKGKVVLIDFWSTTCLPCVRDLPDLKKLYARYHPQGLEIIGISLDSDRTALERFVKKEKVPWPQYYDPGGTTNRLAREFEILSTPVQWLVDAHGLLRYPAVGADREEKVRALLKNP